MIHVLLITFIITLFYLAIANQMLTYIKVLALQGLLLFFVVYLQLKEVSTLNLVLILLETIIFKSVAVPLFLRYILKRNRISRDAEPYVPNFVSLIIVTVIVVITILLSNSIKDTLRSILYFEWSSLQSNAAQFMYGRI